MTSSGGTVENPVTKELNGPFPETINITKSLGYYPYTFAHKVDYAVIPGRVEDAISCNGETRIATYKLVKTEVFKKKTELIDSTIAPL